MANYATLKAAIQDVVKTNGNNEITGALLQQSLLAIIDAIGLGYQFIGIATPATTPGTPDQRVFYIGSAGTYPNFGPAVIPSGNMGVFYYDTEWHVGSVAFPIGDGSITEEKLSSGLLQKLFTDGFKYAGIATPTTNPGTPTQNVFYLATTPGTYTNFGNNIVVNDGEAAIIKYNSSIWTVDVLGVATTSTVSQMQQDIEELDDILNGQPVPTTSTWGSWMGGGTPTRAFKIATVQTVLGGVVTFRLSSYSTYKIDVAFQSGVSWGDPTVYDSGWQTTDIVKTVGREEVGYFVRVAVGRIDNRNITLSEFLSVISELSYVYMAGTSGLVQRVAILEEKVADTSTMIDVIPDYIITGETAINIASISTANGIIVGGGKWGALSVGRHKAIPVTPGEKYIIQGDGKGFWAWLSNSYTTPVTQDSAAPFVTGYTNRVLQKDAVAVTVPSGAMYLYISTVNGVGVSSSWSIWKVDAYKRRTVEMAKIRMAHWNIGGFVYTDWVVGGPTHVIPAEDAPEYAQKYRELLNGINADLIGIAEYNPAFSAANWVTKDVIFQCFNFIYEGTKTGANCNSVFGNIMEWVGQEEIKFTASSYNRYYTHVTARFMGENVHIVEAHLDHTYNQMRVAEISQLIADMSPYRYVIVVGDFNTGDEETIETELAAFTNAGYKMFNDGYIGLVITSLTQEYVDNIVTKGFAMSNIQVSQESGTLSDHLLIYCDLTMNGL